MATTRRRTYTYSAKAWEFKLSFWLVIIIGVVMAFVAIMNLIGVHAFDTAAQWIKAVCTAIALVIPVIMSYQVARHEQTWMFVLWIVCVILVIFGVICAAI